MMVPLANPEFAIDAKIVACAEGGPFVLRLTYSYTGPEDIRIRASQSGGASVVFPDAPWTSGVGLPGRGPGFAPEILELKRGAKWEVDEYCHRFFDGIECGEVMVLTTWVAIDHPSGRVVSIKVNRKRVDVPRKSRAVMQAINAAVGRELARKDISGDRKGAVANWVLGTPHAELVPSAFSILESDPGRYRRELLDFVDSVSKDKERINFYVSYLKQPRPVAANDVLYYLERQDRMKSVDSSQWESLLDKADPLVRLLLYCRVPSRFRDEQARRVLDEASKYKKPVKAEIIESTFRRLKDDSFRVREQATNDLIELGEMAVPAIQEALGKKPTADEEARLNNSLKKITQAIPDAFEKALFTNFRETDSPEADRVIAALAKNHPEAWITKEAIKELKNRKR